MTRSSVGRAGAWLVNRGGRRASPIALILFLGLMVGLPGCGSPSLKIEFVDSAEEFVAQAESGSLHTVDGLALVRVSGTPYERGQQYGLLLKDKIAEMPGFLMALLAHLQGRDPGAMYAAAVALADNVPDQYLEEMRGVADGARLSYEDVLFVNLFFEAVAAIPLSSEPGLGCSQFVALPALTGAGVVHGRNLDLDHLTSEEIGFLQDHSVVLVVSPENGIPHACLTFAGMTSVLTGVNQEGLVLAFNALMGADRLSVGSPLTFFGREVLSGSATRAEAQSCFRETQVLGGVIAVLSDRTGGTVVEVMPRGAGEPRLRFFRETVDGWVAATNHSTQQLYQADPDSIIRYSLLEERLQDAASSRPKSSPVSVMEAVRLLERVAQPREPSLPIATLQSVLFLPVSGDLYFSATGVPSTKGPFIHLTLGGLFSSGDGPGP